MGSIQTGALPICAVKTGFGYAPPPRFLKAMQRLIAHAAQARNQRAAIRCLHCLPTGSCLSADKRLMEERGKEKTKTAKSKAERPGDCIPGNTCYGAGISHLSTIATALAAWAGCTPICRYATPATSRTHLYTCSRPCAGCRTCCTAHCSGCVSTRTAPAKHPASPFRASQMQAGHEP